MKAVISKEWDTSMAGGAIGIENRNKRDVWSIATQPFTGSHFATFPEKLVEPCILAGSRPGDIVFDPFMGSGTVERVAIKLGRVGMGTELNFKYIDGIASKRTSNIQINMQFPINQESNLTQQELIK
jgi:DNA modification methylase